MGTMGGSSPQGETGQVLGQAQGLAFLPMAVDVFGGWLKEGKLGGQLARALGKVK